MTVETYHPGGIDALADRIEWAKHLATANMLPSQFRNQPGNLLLAQEYALSLGIPVGEVLAGSIHVIDGRPSQSAGLMQATVRRAGHRVRSGGDDKAAWCEIVRRDDPTFPFRAEFTIEDARRAGLLGKDNWKKYPRAMLLSRAVSECCKQAAADVLAGIAYTPDELGYAVIDDPGYTAPSGPLNGPAAAVTAAPFGSAAGATLKDEPGPPDRSYAFTDSVESSPGESGSPETVDYAAVGRNARVAVEIDEWQKALDRAVDTLDLDAVKHLGTTAMGSEWPDAAGMAKRARDAWSAVKDVLTRAATDSGDSDPFTPDGI